MIERGCFGRALRIVVNDPVIYLVGGAVLLLVTLISFGLLIGPATCGIVWVTIRHCRGEQVAFSDLFRGFEGEATGEDRETLEEESFGAG